MLKAGIGAGGQPIQASSGWKATDSKREVGIHEAALKDF